MVDLTNIHLKIDIYCKTYILSGWLSPGSSAQVCIVIILEPLISSYHSLDENLVEFFLSQVYLVENIQDGLEPALKVRSDL